MRERGKEINMKKKQRRIISITDLQENLFVRKALDQDHVLYLAELIDSGVEMRDPIEVAEIESPEGKVLTIIDGRHRKHAYELNNVTEIEVEVLEFEDEAEMISYAYQKNVGGAKPPTQADTEHTIDVLIRSGVPKKRIAELLNLPSYLARKYINLVHSKMERQKVMRAAAAVREGGLTLYKAAIQYDVDPESLKVALGGKKKPPKNRVEEIHRNLTKAYKSIGQRHAALIRNLIEKFDDGDVTEQQVNSVFNHIEKLQKQSARTIAEWKKRFEAKIKIDKVTV